MQHGHSDRRDSVSLNEFSALFHSELVSPHLPSIYRFHKRTLLENVFFHTSTMLTICFINEIRSNEKKKLESEVDINKDNENDQDDKERSVL